MSYTIRPYAADDAPAVARCLLSGAAIDDTLLPVSEDEWRSFAGRPFNNGARDFAVAETDEGIAAILISTLVVREPDVLRSVRIIVHPDHRRRGIATRMTAIVDAQDADGETTLRAELPGNWAVGLGLVERRGFEVVERNLWMRLAADVRPPVLAPNGFSLRAYRGTDAEDNDAEDAASDDAAWTRLNREAFLGSSDYLELTTAEREASKEDSRFSLWFAERDGELVGFCQTKEFGGDGCVNSIAVTASCRGRGVGRALLARGIRALREPLENDTSGEIWLTVRAENLHAIALYKSVGFIVHSELLDWWKPRAVGSTP